MAGEQEVVLSLRRPFERVLREGYKLDDKCLRNELCILINYVVTCSASHAFFLERETPAEMTFLEAIVHYSTHDELNNKVSFVGDTNLNNSAANGPSSGSLNNNTQNGNCNGSGGVKPLFTTRDEDVEFKKLLWTCILYLVRDPDNVEAH